MKVRWLFAMAALTMAAAGPAAARETLTLNGEWQYVYADAASPPAQDAAWQPTMVPSTVQWRPDGPHCVWYRKAFTVPAAWRGRRIVLRLEGVKYSHRAVLNGREVGRHLGGYEPVEYDVTGQVRLGENTLLVAAQDWTALVLPGTAGEYSPSAEFVSWVKDGIIAPIGSHGSEVGLWQGVSIEARPAVWVDDVFVRTSVRKHQLQADVTLHNAGAKPARVEVRPRLVSGGPGPDLRARTITVPARGETTIAFSAPWANARLWSPQDPHLYTLRVEAGEDTRDTRFGFRELWTEGEKLILNGTPIRFLATAAHPMAEYDADPKRAYAIAKENGCVAMRLHAQPWPEQWYQAADEAGMLLIWESGLWCYSSNYALTRDEFWQNARQHLAAQMKLQRNHPSIVIWSSENELLHCGGDSIPGTEQRLGDLADFMRTVDPTRPVMCDGDADPVGKYDIVNLHYPHEFPRWNLWPETAFWFDQRLVPDVYPRQEWQWDRRKPLYLGEFLWVPADQQDAGSIFFGDAIYPDPAAYHLRAKATAWEMQVIAARDADVAGLCPWNFWEGGGFPNPGSEAHRRAYQPVAAFPLELSTRAFSDGETQRTLLVFNDSPQARDLEVRWSLKPEAGSWEASGKQRVSLKPTERAHVTAKLTIPETAQPITPAQFTVEVWEGSKKLFSESHPWKVFSRAAVSPPQQESGRWAVFDPMGETAQLLARAGVTFTPLTAEAQLPPGTRVVVIGKNALKKEPGGRIVVGRQQGFYQQLRDFVARGGTLLVFEQEVYPAALIPLTLSQHDASIAFARGGAHPALGRLNDTDFAHWLPDGVVSRREIVKPTFGGFLPLVDSGGPRGLETAGLAELQLGRGRMILCQLNVTDRIEIEPAAAALVQAMLNYAFTPPSPPAATGVVADDTAAAKLDAVGLRYQRLRTPLASADLGRFGQLIVTDPSRLAGSEQVLRRFVAGGGKVVLHGVTPDNRAIADALLGQSFALQQGCDGHVSLADRLGPAAALSNQDLAWFGPKPNLPFAKAELTPDLADYTLGAATRLTGAPVRLEAEAMHPQNASWPRLPGDGGGEAVDMYDNGGMTGLLTVPTAGLYAFAIHARGTPAAGAYPRATLVLDDKPFGSVSAGADWQTLSMVGEVPAGPHTLKVIFANDLFTGAEDRNLQLDWVELIPVERVATGLRFHTEPGVLASSREGKGVWVIDQVRWDRAGSNGDRAARYLSTMLTNLGCEFALESGEAIEPPQFQVTGQVVTQSPETIAFGTNGEAATEVEFATPGQYTFALFASGTAVGDIYPRVELRLDATTVGAFDLLGPDWQTYRLAVPVTAGVHRVVLAFVNDEWRPPEDRNLSIGRLVIGSAAQE
jgi:beta-galactosidase